MYASLRLIAMFLLALTVAGFEGCLLRVCRRPTGTVFPLTPVVEAPEGALGVCVS